MKIHIRQITKDGYNVVLTGNEAWLTAIIANLFPDHRVDLPSISGEVRLDNFEGNVSLTGQIAFTHHPLCARCGTELTRQERIPLRANLIPVKAVDGVAPGAGEEEIELAGDDLDFAFYENEEVDIAPVINDEIALALPYNYYCPNEVQCAAAKAVQAPTAADAIDPRWAALKNIKIR